MEATIGVRAITGLLLDWRSAAGPAYLVLADRIRLLVLDGRLPGGVRLPAERELAAGLGVSRTTVAAAFDALRASGHLRTRQGSGSRVRVPGSAASGSAGAVPQPYDLAKAAWPASPVLHDAAVRALDRMPTAYAGSGYGFQGIGSVREAVAQRFRDRGVPTSADEIVLTTGAQAAIALAARTLLGRGDRVLVEAPGYPHAFEALRLAGGRLVATPVDTTGGWSPDLPAALRRVAPALAYLMPDFHNPTGRSMPDADRAALVAAAADAATVLLVDETTAELDIDRPAPTTPLAVLGGSGATVVTIGSASKTVWGGLRIGWIRAPEPIVAALLAARPATDLGTPVFEQLVLQELLAEWPAVLRHRRADLRAARDALGPALRAALPDWSVPEVDGGLSFWVALPAPVASRFALAAREAGVLLPAGSWFGLDGAFERFVRVPFTTPAAEQPGLVDRLVRAWAAAGATAHAPEERAPALV